MTRERFSPLILAKRAAQLAHDPCEAVYRVRERMAERKELRHAFGPYEADPEWERRIHLDLGLPWPCPAATEFWALWPEVIGSLQSKGLQIGVGFFAGWNDGEPEITRLIWCLVRHMRPLHVVETGVGRGITSRFILEALEHNGKGHLSSIDLPQLDPALNRQVGVAVEERLRHRWTCMPGSSRRRLPSLLASLGAIELFIHDSRHTEYNLRFELEQAWKRLAAGGMVVADDVDTNRGFRTFTEAHPGQLALICPAMPLQPDPRRFNSKGLFGVVRKNAGML